MSLIGIASPALAQVAPVAVPTATPAPQVRPAQPPPPPGYGWPAPQQQGQPPQTAVAPNGEYVAPLSQTTQPYYVPQSVALSGPRFIKDYQDGDPIVYGYHRETRVRKGAIIGGAITFGVPYLYSAFFASIGADAASNGESNKLGYLFVPVFGPFAEMSQTDSVTARYMLALDGLAQGIGAGLFIFGIASPKPILVRNDLALVAVTPVRMGQDGNGVGFVGRF